MVPRHVSSSCGIVACAYVCFLGGFALGGGATSTNRPGTDSELDPLDQGCWGVCGFRSAKPTQKRNRYVTVVCVCLCVCLWDREPWWAMTSVVFDSHAIAVHVS